MFCVKQREGDINSAVKAATQVAAMKLNQENIDLAVKLYNQVTKAHKRPPVEAYVRKRLSAGEAVELSSGTARWSSALILSGSKDDFKAEFKVNPALPAAFKEHSEKMKEEFERSLKDFL
jgi:hypothetical protein